MRLRREPVNLGVQRGAWGEAVAGAAKGTRNSVMITLGTGVGGGIIIDNKVYSGFNYAGAELGHIVICAGGKPCSCGRHGCWEAYSSATALTKMTEDKINACVRSGRKTLMKDIADERGKISARTSYDAQRRGDYAATEVINEYLHYLAIGITNIINIFQPEVLCIGGGISREGETLLAPVREIIENEEYSHGLDRRTMVKIAALAGDAGLYGAAALGIAR